MGSLSRAAWCPGGGFFPKRNSLLGRSTCIQFSPARPLPRHVFQIPQFGRRICISFFRRSGKDKCRSFAPKNGTQDDEFCQWFWQAGTAKSGESRNDIDFHKVHQVGGTKRINRARGVGERPEDWPGSSVHDDAGTARQAPVIPTGLRVDRVLLPTDPRTRL